MVELSFKELGARNNLAVEDWIQGSVYVSPKSHWGLTTLANDAYNFYPKLEKPAGYICLLQGVKPGNEYKLRLTDLPKDLGGNLALALQLNNPHDVHSASKPIKFRCCIIKAEYADSFRSFLHKRYSEHKKISGWFELDNSQLREICSSGKP